MSYFSWWWMWLAAASRCHPTFPRPGRAPVIVASLPVSRKKALHLFQFCADGGFDMFMRLMWHHMILVWFNPEKNFTNVFKYFLFFCGSFVPCVSWMGSWNCLLHSFKVCHMLPMVDMGKYTFCILMICDTIKSLRHMKPSLLFDVQQFRLPRLASYSLSMILSNFWSPLVNGKTHIRKQFWISCRKMT